MAKIPEQFITIIEREAAAQGVDPELIKAIVIQESGGNPNAVSRVGAKGLMQLMPGTASDLGVTNPFDPTQNIRGGTRYIKQMINQFGSVEDGLAAYNWGPGNFNKYVKRGRTGNVPSETRNYVKNITRAYKAGDKRAAAAANTPPPAPSPVAIPEVVEPAIPEVVEPIIPEVVEPVIPELMPTAQLPAQTPAPVQVPGQETNPLLNTPPLPQGPISFQTAEDYGLFPTDSIPFTLGNKPMLAIPESGAERQALSQIDQYDVSKRESMIRFLGELDSAEAKVSSDKPMFSQWPTFADDRIKRLISMVSPAD